MAEYVVARPLNREPVHPGEIMKEDVLPALGRLEDELSKIEPVEA